MKLTGPQLALCTRIFQQATKSLDELNLAISCPTTINRLFEIPQVSN